MWTLVLLLDPHSLPKDAAVLHGDGSSMRALRAEMLQTLVPLLHALSWPAADGQMRHVMAAIVRCVSHAWVTSHCPVAVFSGSASCC